jgi:hypothetical protein
MGINHIDILKIILLGLLSDLLTSVVDQLCTSVYLRDLSEGAVSQKFLIRLIILSYQLHCRLLKVRSIVVLNLLGTHRCILSV